MKKVLHVSTECFPAAKDGGMGDVVGSLPNYLPKFGIEASVVVPKYNLPWFREHSFIIVAQGSFMLDSFAISYSVQKLSDNSVSYPFYCIDLPGLFDRESIYLNEWGVGYGDERERNLSFQRAVMHWLEGSASKFDLIHCHDHQTSFLPFFMLFAHKMQSYRSIPSYYTIHNAAYNSTYDWSNIFKFPACDDQTKKLLDWNGHIDGFATALKSAWKVNTVSPNYMSEISRSHYLSPLLHHERNKCKGILNGIDAGLWDPRTDKYLKNKLSRSWPVFKKANKKAALADSNLDIEEPLIGFIGRFAHQKGADVLMDTIERSIQAGLKANYFVLGSGDKYLEDKLKYLQHRYGHRIRSYIGYSEEVARLVYAACDFLIMPSRFEPCGLNQLFAMRYGTIPVVNATGGLLDTVPDYTNYGNGIQFFGVNVENVFIGIQRAVDLYFHKTYFEDLRKKVSKIEWSWDKSAEEYANDYKDLIDLGEKKRKAY